MNKTFIALWRAEKNIRFTSAMITAKDIWLWVFWLFVGIVALRGWPLVEDSSQVRSVSELQSMINNDIARRSTSRGLSNADLAWHAVKTYGWDCYKVIARLQYHSAYYEITCSSGLKLRVYPRPGKHPRITNIYGTYEDVSN